MRVNTFASLLGFWLVAATTASTLLLQGNSPVVAQPQNIQKQQADRFLVQAKGKLDRGSLLAAKGDFQQALRIYQTIGDAKGQQDCLVGLATIDYREARYSQALVNLRQAERFNAGNPSGKLLAIKGLIYLELGDYRDAIQNLKTGLHYLRVSGNRDRSGLRDIQQARVALGEAYLYLGQYQQAISQRSASQTAIILTFQTSSIYSKIK